ncbi:hypothetical protein ABW20_dc0103187 [Dactylellina cionopaga]|nr:hypothetical protein ABW20_dc0103187 [Dactylellina cionopaga]
MKSVLFITLVAQGLALVNATSCSPNNCARAVTGTSSGCKIPVASRRADCSSVQRYTVVPAASTTTVYTTITPATVSVTQTSVVTKTSGTITVTLPAAAKNKRDVKIDRRQAVVTPSSFPTYASAFAPPPATVTTTFTGTTIVTSTTVVPETTVSVCPVGLTKCPDATQCTDLLTDPQNCNTCGNKCPTGSECRAGSCQSQAPSCTTTCTGPSQKCGAAGSTCFCLPILEGGSTCISGASGCGTLCNSSAECPNGHSCYGGSCCHVGTAFAGACVMVSNCPSLTTPTRIFRVKLGRSAGTSLFGTIFDKDIMKKRSVSG